jgi:hypothetical protein
LQIAGDKIFSHRGTAIIFIYWNSSLSQSLLDYLNNLGLGVARTIDLTDFIAFIALPISYRYFGYQRAKPKITLNYLVKTGIVCVTLFSFIATTLPQKKIEIHKSSGKVYTLDISKKEVFNRMKPSFEESDTLPLNLVDSLFYLRYYVPEIKSKMVALATIQEINMKTQITLDTILYSWTTGALFFGINPKLARTVRKTTKTEHQFYFETFFIDRLSKHTEPRERPHYDNKFIYDQLGEQFGF